MPLDRFAVRTDAAGVHLVIDLADGAEVAWSGDQDIAFAACALRNETACGRLVCSRMDGPNPPSAIRKPDGPAPLASVRPESAAPSMTRRQSPQ